VLARSHLLRTEAPVEGRRFGEPVVVAGGRIPEVDVGIQEPAQAWAPRDRDI
jgi:hypothetical protein